MKSPSDLQIKWTIKVGCPRYKSNILCESFINLCGCVERCILNTYFFLNYVASRGRELKKGKSWRIISLPLCQLVSYQISHAPPLYTWMGFLKDRLIWIVLRETSLQKIVDIVLSSFPLCVKQQRRTMCHLESCMLCYSPLGMRCSR